MAKPSKRLRYEVLRRDGFRCRYCGATPAEAELHIDHVVPEALGGATEAANLATACEPCNSGKSSMPPDAPIVDEVARDALRWARAMQVAAAGQRADREIRDLHRAGFLEEWSLYSTAAASWLPAEWPTSIDAFVRAGLDEGDMAEAIGVAMSKKHIRPTGLFKYFCGVCWTMIKKRRETAATLVHLVPDEAGD
jgi:hypothetical protein